MAKWILPLQIFVSLIIFTGCSHSVNVHEALVAEAHLLPTISSPGPVAVIDESQKPPGDTQFCDAFGRTYTTNYNEFSAYAVQSIKNLLTRNDIKVIDSADKQLIISDLDASCGTEGLLDFNMTITVATGDGLKKQFKGNQRFFHLYERHFSLSAATLNAALEMFKDEEILKYLKQQ